MQYNQSDNMYFCGFNWANGYECLPGEVKKGQYEL